MGHLNTGNIHYQDILESGIQLADLLECLSGFQMVLWRPSCTKPFESWTFKFSFQIVGCFGSHFGFFHLKTGYQTTFFHSNAVGLEIQTLASERHTKSECFKSLISNGSIFDWSVAVHTRTDHSKSEHK